MTFDQVEISAAELRHIAELLHPEKPRLAAFPVSRISRKVLAPPVPSREALEQRMRNAAFVLRQIVKDAAKPEAGDDPGKAPDDDATPRHSEWTLADLRDAMHADTDLDEETVAKAKRVLATGMTYYIPKEGTTMTTEEPDATVAFEWVKATYDRLMAAKNETDFAAAMALLGFPRPQKICLTHNELADIAAACSAQPRSARETTIHFDDFTVTIEAGDDVTIERTSEQGTTAAD